MVGQDLSGLRVLDAFGGSGLLGLEAWSRGAHVVVVERRADVARALRGSGERVGADWEVVVGDVLGVAPRLGRFDGVLADPPYALEAAPILDVLGPVATSWLVYEADAKAVARPRAGALTLDRVRTFGGTALWLYRGGDDDHGPG
jgi:16S rRNA (guanine966-N2)-methyltransferase